MRVGAKIESVTPSSIYTAASSTCIMVLKLTAAQLSEIRRHGEATYPHECCGVLTGEMLADGGKRVLAVAQCGNTHNDPLRSWYQIDPRELMHVQREAYERGEDIIGFYHSHPDDAAQWSVSDLEEAHWTGCSYLITSVERGTAAQTNSFELAGDEASKRFEHEEIVVDDSTPPEVRER
jgi:proteasome lid subunit RPN8/RPN11